MPSELLESSLRITWDPEGAPVVLVNYGDDLAGEITLDGQQAVDIVPFVRAAGVTTYDRGNEQHQINIPLSVETPDVPGAHASVFAIAKQLPRSGDADCLIEIEGGGAYTLKSATIQGWTGTPHSRISDHGISIVCGLIETTAVPPSVVGPEYLRPDGSSRYLRPTS